jgi:nuclear pore complex protein Nup133
LFSQPRATRSRKLTPLPFAHRAHPAIEQVHAWSIPADQEQTEGGADPVAYAEVDRTAEGGAPGDVAAAVASSDAGATLWVVAAGPAAGDVAVARCSGAGTEEMGVASLGEGDDREINAPPRVTSMAAVARRGGGVVCVAGCDDGRLFLVECAARGGVHAVEMRRDTSGRGAGGGGSLTPSKWGAAALSATKAALSFLREPSAAADTAATEVRSLSWAPAAAGGGLRLLALTDAAVEEWEVDRDGNGGYGLVQTHRATAEIARALRTDASRFELVSASPAPGTGEGAAVILAALGGAKRLSMHRVERRRGNASVTLVASATPPAGTVPASNRDGAATTHAGGVPSDAALVVTAAGGAALFAGDRLDQQLLMHDPAAGGGRVLAAAAAPGTGGWLMLTELMGVVAYAPTPGGDAAATAAAGVAPPVSARVGEPPRSRDDRGTTIAAAAAVSVTPAAAEASVRAEFASFANGTGGAPAESGFRLKAAGALAEDGRAGAPFAANSRNLVDALPKHWSGPSGPGPATESHLDEKARRHDLFLRFLAEAAGVWTVVAPAEREAVLEHGELVAALLCVRALHNEAAEASEADDAEAEDGALAVLREAAAAAGVALQAHDAAVRDRPAAEVCYSRATGVPGALLPALADGFARRASVAAAERGASLRQRAEALDALSRALLGALGAAAEFRAHHAALYPPPGGGATAPPPRWSSGANARAALREAASATAALREESARGGAPELVAPLGARLLALATPLLDACAANLESAAPGTAERAVAREEYVRARRDVLPALLDAARDEAGAPAHAVGVSADAVAAVAEAHFGYEQLAEVCEAVSHEAETARDPGAVAAAAARTHHYMRTLRGAPADGEGSFATYFFERARKHAGFAGSVGARVAETLRNTPDEFYDELETCLEPHPSLLWVHQLRAENYSGAARTARGLADGGASLAERRRFLSLAKLSLLADGVASVEDDVVALDAALDLVSIQSNLSRRRGSGSDEDAPLPPLRLVEACLGDAAEGAGAPGRDEDLLDAFAVFASAGSTFRASNKSLLETLWRRAAAETDWEQLSELRASGGDEGYVQALRATLVARATRRCYDETAVRLGAPFSEAMSESDVLGLLESAIGGGDAASALRDAVGLYANGDGDDEMM